jgi:hypothetical protein
MKSQCMPRITLDIQVSIAYLVEAALSIQNFRLIRFPWKDNSSGREMAKTLADSSCHHTRSRDVKYR